MVLTHTAIAELSSLQRAINLAKYTPDRIRNFAIIGIVGCLHAT